MFATFALTSSSPDSIAALDRLLWVQDFVMRLLDLGAPAPTEHLVRLGEAQYNASFQREPASAAEFVWGQWPTESGDL